MVTDDVGSDDDLDEDNLFVNSPEKVPGISKYRGYWGGGNGLFCAESFKGYKSLSPRLVEVLVRSANNGLAESTWKQVFCRIPQETKEILVFFFLILCSIRG